MVALTVGATAAGLVASRFGIRFDGFINVRSDTPGPVPLPLALADQVVCLFIRAALAWVIVRAFGAPARFDALLLTFGAIRIPLILVSPAALAMDQPDPSSTAVLTVVIGALVAWIWVVALLANGLRYSSGLTGRRLAAATACGMVAAEVVTSLVMTTIG